MKSSLMSDCSFTNWIFRFTALLFDASKNYWHHIVDMKETRFGHACGIINHNEILVAGGGNGEDLLNTVEILSLAVLGEWRTSAPLPEALGSMVSLQYGTTVLVFGGTSIYHFDEASEVWDTRNETAPTQRSGFIVIPISGNLDA